MKHMIAMVTKSNDVVINEKKKRSKKYLPRGSVGPNHIADHLVCMNNGYWFWFTRPMWTNFTGISPATLYTREKQLATRPIRQIVGLDEWIRNPHGRPKGSKNTKGRKK